MEMSLTFAASPSRPLSFFNNGGNNNLFNQFQTTKNPSLIFPTSCCTTNRSTGSSLHHGRRSSSSRRRRNGGSMCVVKALKVEEEESSISREKLSRNWDLCNYDATSAAAPSLPRFEDLDVANMLLRQRIIFLGSQVDDMTADLVISQLLFLDAEDHEKDIKLFINSPGGSVTAGMGIYDAMKLCKADVSTVCLGLAASMGAFLLASGTKGKRFCMPNARVMIHQPLGTAGGKATEMGIRIREMVYHKIKLNKIFSRITGKPESQIEMDTDRDNFMNPWEAKEYGLIDAVIDDGKPGLVAPIGDSKPPPKTRVWDMWKVEGSRKAKKNLPSEDRVVQNGTQGGQGGDERGTEQEKETPAPV